MGFTNTVSKLTLAVDLDMKSKHNTQDCALGKKKKPCNSNECKIIVIRKGTFSRLEDNEMA